MAGIGRRARKATDALSPEALNLMQRGFREKKTSAEIARQIGEETGEHVNPRTAGRRATEWHKWWNARSERIDEMHALVEATRQAGVGVVILASPTLLERLEKSRTRDLGALSSRVAIWAALNGVQKQEAAEILRQEGVSQIDDGAFNLLYSATRGSMRRLMAVTDLLVTKHGGKPVTEKTIEGVGANL